MKKIIIGFLAGFLFATASSVFADDGLQKIEAYLRPSLPITLNGQSVTLGSPPVMYDGSTYLKLRDVAQLTGLQVNWNDATQTIELQNSTKGAAPMVEATAPTETTFNGLKAIVVNGVTYFNPGDYNRTSTDKIWGFDSTTRNTYIQYKDSTKKVAGNVDDITVAQKYKGETYINIKYYEAP